MFTPVQKEILQILIDLYKKSNYRPVKGEEIASVMNRNPGTIRNQMQYLRSLHIVEGVSGPKGGYKPTLEAYQTLNINVTDEEATVPIFKKGKKVEDVTVTKIEFGSIPHPAGCEATINVMGNIKQFNLGEELRVGPTPVNKLVINGKIVGRDDTDNILLLDVGDIQSIPNRSVLEIASQNLITLDPNMDIKEAAWILSNNGIDGAPVIEGHDILGILTLTDITKAIANEEKDLKITKLMSKYIITVKQNVKLPKVIETLNKNKIGRLIVVDENEKPLGIVTKTDIINRMAGLYLH
ncbi:CBS domain-containing protein [Methanobacterium aggregans]|uniref:CBS domain-containing protein n=1 Tax=Methanobacterium aggregans TaxID=1615586 RepID=UPI001AE194CF|nr:CBS domain-containing protein [Methanobacterium aggregans]MBP2046324.1 putative transcriptional regulator [Methanobacterium aggregans]